MLQKNHVHNMDCLDGFKLLDDNSCDMLFSDWPYGTTQCQWDVPLPLDQIWPEIKRVVKPNGAIVLFSAQPFTTDLIVSNRKMFRYEIIWEKTQAAGFLNAKKMPLRTHENILVFYQKLPTYNPIMWQAETKSRGGSHTGRNGKMADRYLGTARKQVENRAANYNGIGASTYHDTGMRFPTDVIQFSSWNGALFGKTDNATKHPTQKPVDLCEYIIKTYSNPGDTVLDNCAGSGSIPLAAKNTGRQFYAFEMDAKFCEIANSRVARMPRC